MTPTRTRKPGRQDREPGSLAEVSKQQQRKIAIAAAVILLGAAIATELRKPVVERTGRGTVLGIPYDLRTPTWPRVRNKLWDPDNPALLVPHVFGVGWTVNLARLRDLVARRR
jgi:hypothetical protein